MTVMMTMYACAIPRLPRPVKTISWPRARSKASTPTTTASSPNRKRPPNGKLSKDFDKYTSHHVANWISVSSPTTRDRWKIYKASRPRSRRSPKAPRPPTSRTISPTPVESTCSQFTGRHLLHRINKHMMRCMIDAIPHFIACADTCHLAHFRCRNLCRGTGTRLKNKTMNYNYY